STNLYFTDARAYAAAKSILTAGSNVTITPDDDAKTLTIAASGEGGGGGGRVYTNPPFANVSLLLHCDGANGSTTITDQVAGNTWTANNATISTAQAVVS